MEHANSARCCRILTTLLGLASLLTCPTACLPFHCAARVPMLNIPTGAPPMNPATRTIVPSSASQHLQQPLKAADRPRDVQKNRAKSPERAVLSSKHPAAFKISQVV